MARARAYDAAMRRPFIVLALIVPAAAAAQPQAPVGLHGSLFLSPMGQPFRSGDPAADNAGAWFAAADRERDGALTLDELREDAARFFATLDTDRDGEIGPAEMARYENEVAPEVQVGLQMRGSAVGESLGRREQRRRGRVAVYAEGIEGAGRYAFLNIPQPVIAADFDMNRGVSREEFGRAADQRFQMLDRDRDGRLVRAELPPLPQRRIRRPGQGNETPVRRIGNRRY
jgi:hypothetical protein